jgi:hypothetical protein
MNMIKKAISLVSSASLLVFAVAGTASSQTVKDSADFAAYLEALVAGARPEKNVYAPGVMHAVVAPNGTAFVSASLFSPRGGTPGNGPDGSVTFGIGLGNADSTVGVGISMNATGTVPFAQDGDFTVKFSKTIASSDKGKTYLGIQFNRIAPWGGNVGQAKSFDVAVTHFTSFPTWNGGTPVMVTWGYGSENMWGPGGFFALGLGLTQNTGVGVSLKNGMVTAGLGYKVPEVPGLSLSLDFANINRGGFGPASNPVISLGVHFAKANFFGR